MQLVAKNLFCAATFLMLFASCARKEDPAKTIVYVTLSGTKYHAKACPYLGKDAMLLLLPEAIQRGYSPCTECHPHPDKLKQPATPQRKQVQRPPKKQKCIAHKSQAGLAKNTRNTYGNPINLAL